jgi:hypothetical protein
MNEPHEALHGWILAHDAEGKAGFAILLGIIIGIFGGLL